MAIGISCNYELIVLLLLFIIFVVSAQECRLAPNVAAFNRNSRKKLRAARYIAKRVLPAHNTLQLCIRILLKNRLFTDMTKSNSACV